MAVEKAPDTYAVQASPMVGSTLINIRGGSVAEFRKNLEEVASNAEEISTNLTTITAKGNLNEVLNHGVPASSVSAAQAANTPPPPVAPPAMPPAGPAPTCNHGSRIYEQFNRKSDGKLMKKWVCPVKKANWRDPNGCQDQWA